MINKDTNPKAQQDQQLRHASNVNPLREVGGLPVEEGNSLLFDVLGTIVGSRVFNERISIIFTHVAATDDIIYRKTGDTLAILFRGDLGFNKTINVQCRIVPDSKNNLIAYFTDNLNPMRFINTTVPQTDIDDMLYFISSSTPIDIEGISVSESGGAVPAGCWFAFVSLVDDNEIETNFLSTRPIYITDGDADLNKYDGVDGGTITSKAISVKVINIDTRFKFLRFVFISRQDGVYQNGRQFDFRITGSTEIFTFSGQETFVERTIEETVVPKPLYNTVKTLAYNDNTLYLGNCTEGKDIGAQPYINNSVVIPISADVNMNTFHNSHRDANTLFVKTGFFNDEVVAPFVVFNLKNGNKSAAYHVAGRAPLTIGGIAENATWSQLQTINPALYTSLNGNEHSSIGNNAPMHTTLDTNLLEASYPVHRMSFWENLSEFYPDTDDWDIKDVSGNVTGTLRNKKVRHHKFPSNRSPFNGCYSLTNSTNGTLRAAGFFIELNLPQFIKDQIHSVEIYYARKDGNNQRLVSQNHFFPMDVNEDGELYSEALLPIVYLGQILPENLSSWSVLRLSSFDLLLGRPPTATFDYFKIDITLQQVPSTVEQLGPFGYDEQRAHFDGRVPTVVAYSPLTANGIRKILRADYIQADSKVSINGYQGYNVVNNLQGENTVILQYQNPYTFVQWEDVFKIDIPGGGLINLLVLGQVPSSLRAIPILTLYDYKTDVYKSFMQQELIFATRTTDSTTMYVEPLPIVPPFGGLIAVFGGDCFLTDYSYRTTSSISQGANKYLKHVYSFPIQSHANVWFRQAGAGIAGMYFPKTPIQEYIERINVSDFIKYNKDFSTLNNLEVPVIYDPDFVERDRHFTRIHKTLPQGVERGNLRTLLAEDFIDLPTHRGELVAINTIKGVLVPHMEKGTFRTYGTQQLNADINSITIKSVDIFNVTPDEILETDLGYGGCQSINTAINTPHGAFWVDKAAGKIFLLSDSIAEISAKGLFNFFEKSLRSNVEQTVLARGGTLISDTPSNQYGLHAWYHQRYRRIFMTVQDYKFINPEQYIGDYNPVHSYSLGNYITIAGSIYIVVVVFTEVHNGAVPVNFIPLNAANVYGVPVQWDSAHFTSIKFTAAYYPEREGWCFYSFTPYHAIASETEMLTTGTDTSLWRHGAGFLSFYGQLHSVVVEIVVQHKQQGNLQALAIDFQNLDGGPEAPSSIMVSNTRQNSGEIMISTNKNFGNIRFVTNYWMFNTIRDCVVDRNSPMFDGTDATGLEILSANVDINKKSFTKAFLNDTFHIVRFKYTPVTEKDVTLFSIQPQAVKSNRL